MCENEMCENNEANQYSAIIVIMKWLFNNENVKSEANLILLLFYIINDEVVINILSILIMKA